jgi:hypothetical protein
VGQYHRAEEDTHSVGWGGTIGKREEDETQSVGWGGTIGRKRRHTMWGGVAPYGGRSYTKRGVGARYVDITYVIYHIRSRRDRVGLI